MADLVRQVNKKNKILALDQSTRVSGWSFFENGELKSFGHWSHTADDVAIRINNLCQEIESKIDGDEPDIVLIENIQLQQIGNREGNVQTFQKLAQVQGAIMRVCIQKQVPYKLVYPSEWRKNCKFLAGNDKHRENQKKVAQQWVLDTYGVKCIQDEADAICIGYSEVIQQNNAIEWD